MVLGSPEAPAPKKDAEPIQGHGRNGASSYTGAKRVAVPHPTLQPGDACPGCEKGKVYPRKEPRVLVRMVGQAPLAATVYELDRLRCNLCGEVFTAREPEGIGPEKYDETTAAMIALLKYGSGMPFYRLEKLEQLLGIPLSASTQWEIVEEAAEVIQAARDELIRQAAQGEVLHNDDTSMRVLHLAREPSDERTGVFTSGIVSTQQGQRIALYFTGRQHAGENLRDVLDHRAGQLATPVQMCDALSRNTPKLEDGAQILLANCLAHGRRQFVEVAANFPEPMPLRPGETLGSAYKYDAQARAAQLSPQERLVFHQHHSQPVMKTLHEWLEAQFAQHLVEPNSGLGKAITYFLRHWKGLTAFLREAGAPVDNNLCERAQTRRAASQECVVLSHAARLGGRRPVYEPDPLLRTGGRECLRLPQPVAAPHRRTGRQPHGVDAVELYRPKPLVSGHPRLLCGNAHQTQVSAVCFQDGFWPPPSGWLVCSRFHS